MQENVQQSPVMRAIKKAWPVINRFVNGVLYFIMGVIKNIIKGAMDQFKGGMKA